MELYSQLKNLFLFLVLVLTVAGCSGQHVCMGDENCKPWPVPSNKVTPAENRRFAKFKSAVLDAHCVKCHNPGKKEDDIDLTSLDAILNTKNLVVPGDPDESDLYLAVWDDSMPPKNPLTNELKEAIRLWILDFRLVEPLPPGGP